MTSLYRTIVHASGGTYYQGEPITLADAQMMLSNDIAEGKVEVGAFLKVDEETLILNQRMPHHRGKSSNSSEAFPYTV